MIRAETKRIVRATYVLRCGYCTVTEQSVGAELTYDHYKPVSAGGSDEVDNIVYACHACNAFKSDFWREAESERLLHPLRDDFSAHIYEEADGMLVGLSARGTAHIESLHLNRFPLIAHRFERKGLAQSRENMTTLRHLLYAVLIRLDEQDQRQPN